MPAATRSGFAQKQATQRIHHATFIAGRRRVIFLPFHRSSAILAGFMRRGGAASDYFISGFAIHHLLIMPENDGGLDDIHAFRIVERTHSRGWRGDECLFDHPRPALLVQQ